jgi:hypothetical protein
VRAQIDDVATSLFAGIFGVPDIAVGDVQKACAGTARALAIWEQDDGPEGIPVVLNPGGGRDCFAGNGSSTALVVGRECVIWGNIEDADHNRLLWVDTEDCAGDVDGTSSEIGNGIGGAGWRCEEDDEIEIRRPRSNSTSAQSSVLLGFRDRLNDGTDCDSNESGQPNDQSFRNAFGRADGLPGVLAVPPPPFSGGSSTRNAIYIQNDCFDNPRIVIVPWTRDNIGGSDNQDRVQNVDIDGFAVVYLTGCYRADDDDNIPEPNSLAETQECGGQMFEDTEVRGVPIRLFISPDSSIGEMGAITDANFPLTIQTVE